MSRDHVKAVRDRVDAARDLDEPLLREASEAIRGVFPTAPLHPESLSEPTEAVLHMIDRCLPGWTIRLHGRATEPDGHWHCTLRESEERDNDAFIGAGKAPTVGLALLEALLDVAVQRSRP